MIKIQRLSAFTTTPEGGNPAGVALDAGALSASEMLRLAAEVGYSETAFITAVDSSGERPQVDIRYFSPELEVDFCGHATIATAVAWAEEHGPGNLLLQTAAGPIEVEMERDAEGFRATLTSVPTRIDEVSQEALAEALAALRWSPEDLSTQLPPRVAFGGVYHLVLAAGTRERLAKLDYDFERLKALMLDQNWTTLQLVFQEEATLFHARNPFPVGGVVEDPATGAAAVAFGGYLRDLGKLQPGEQFRILQGEDMGRKSHLYVEISQDGERIRVSGHACSIGEPIRV